MAAIEDNSEGGGEGGAVGSVQIEEIVEEYVEVQNRGEESGSKKSKLVPRVPDVEDDNPEAHGFLYRLRSRGIMRSPAKDANR